MTDDIDDDLLFGSYEGCCKGCDDYAPVDDIGLCETCADKMDRDLIRKRDWAYSASAYGVPPDRREDLRKHVIKEYGEKLELLAADPPEKGQSKSRKKKRNRRR